MGTLSQTCRTYSLKFGGKLLDIQNIAMEDWEEMP